MNITKINTFGNLNKCDVQQPRALCFLAIGDWVHVNSEARGPWGERRHAGSARAGRAGLKWAGYGGSGGSCVVVPLAPEFKQSRLNYAEVC